MAVRDAADRTWSGPAAEPMGKFEWQRLILSLDLAPHTKLVALAMSIYASRDGANAHPGNVRLRLELRLSRTTVLRHLAILRDDLQLIERTLRVRAGRPGRGRHARADVYQLVVPADLPNRARFVEYGQDAEVVSDAGPLNDGSGRAAETTSAPEVVSIATGSGLNNSPEVVSPVRPQQVVEQAENHQVVVAVVDASVEVDGSRSETGPEDPDSEVVSANGHKPHASLRPTGLTDEQWADIAWLAEPAAQLATQHRGRAS